MAGEGRKLHRLSKKFCISINVSSRVEKYLFILCHPILHMGALLLEFTTVVGLDLKYDITTIQLPIIL